MLESQDPPLTVQLHPSQRDFVADESVYKAFVGGVGSGKSWAGAYNLIRKSKAGRLYLVAAPTYTMLSDATMRSFVNVATGLNVLNPKDVKQNPPSARLRTGAEVLFRSADDPNRLYGPNLSGIWLDEASLMAVDVFNVGIGRLREGGEQGWLACTFTPKGKLHWTYETFATGRPNTALHRCKTADNPFLPETFAETARTQYTAALALQELGGEFTDVEGSLFMRNWLPIVERPPREGRRVRYWDQAGTQGGGAYTAGVLVNRHEHTYYVEDVVRGQWSPGARDRVILQTAHADRAQYGRVEQWFEQEPGSGGLESAQQKVKLLAGFVVHIERVTGDKVTRCEPLAAQCEAGNVKIVRGRWNAAYLDELTVFPQGQYKDQADASGGAFNKLAKATQQLWLRTGGETYNYTTGEVMSASKGPRVVTLEELKEMCHDREAMSSLRGSPRG